MEITSLKPDAIDCLLQNRPHPTAQQLLAFHHANDTFFPNFAAEFLWLKKRDRQGAGKILLMFLRKKHWQQVDERMVNQNIFPLLVRLCILCYPVLNDGTMELRQCEADEILGTSVIARKGKTILQPGEGLRLELSQLPPMPEPREVQRRSKRRRTVKPEESAFVYPFIKELVAESPHPRSRLLQVLLRHARKHPEIFCLAVKDARKLPLEHFSVLDVIQYAAQTAKRSAEPGKRFTLPGELDGLYCRALIRFVPQLNGYCTFNVDSQGRVRKGHSNALLGCYIATERVNGEPHPRLLWYRDGGSL